MQAKYETDLIVRKVDEDGDMIWGHGKLDYLQGLEAMAQVIRYRLAAIQGEWWEGDATALPYYSDFLTAYQTDENRARIDLMIIERILDTRGVLSVSDVSSSMKNRKYNFKANVLTVYGITKAEVSL